MRRPTRRFRVLAISCAATLAAAAVVAYATAESRRSLAGPALVWPNYGGGAHFHLPASKVDSPYSFGGIIICLDRPGEVSIERVAVEPDKPGIRIDAFALRANPYLRGKEGVGEVNAPLEKLGFTPGRPHIVKSVCLTEKESNNQDAAASIHAVNQGRGGSELVMQYSRQSAETRTATKLIVDYRSAGKARRLVIPWAVTLCAPGDATSLCRTD